MSTEFEVGDRVRVLRWDSERITPSPQPKLPFETTVKALRRCPYVGIQLPGESDGDTWLIDSANLELLPKRPPCDACGEESCQNPSVAGKATYNGGREFGALNLCLTHWRARCADVERDVRARRAKQTSGSGKSPYDAAGVRRERDPSPYDAGAVSDRRKRGRNKNSFGPVADTRKDSGGAVDAAADPTRPEAQRWQTRDPARIAALEAKLAEQVASGGQDGKSARWLLERADRLRREEEDRQLGLSREHHSGWQPGYLQACNIPPGPRLSRHELPASQRLDRKLTGR